MKGRKIIVMTAICLVICLFGVAAIGCSDQSATTEDAATNEDTGAIQDSVATQEDDDSVGEELVIGYAVMNTIDEYWNTQIIGMKKAVADNGDLDIRFEVADNNNDNEQTLTNVDNLINRGVQYLICSVIDSTIGSSIIEKCQAAGVVVIASDVPIGDESTEGYYELAFDNYQCGYGMGEYAAERFAKEHPDEIPVVAYLDQAASADVCTVRCDGFKDAITEAYPDAVSLEYQDTEGNREKAATVTADLLTANPDLNIIMCVNDAAAMGAAATVEERGLTADDVVTYGQGGASEDTFYTLMSGSPFVASMSYKPHQTGYKIINDIIIPLAQGQTFDSYIFYAATEVADADNAQEILDEILEWKAEVGG